MPILAWIQGRRGNRSLIRWSPNQKCERVLTLPDLPTSRDTNEPIPTGNLAGWKMDMKKFNQMLDEYYDLHGWDRATGFPKRKTLVDLDLTEVFDDLEKIGKLR